MQKSKISVLDQYLTIKEKYKDSILFYRIGEFYELLFEDAVLGSKILGVALTKLGGASMCGIPARSLDIYVSKLIKAGKKVAICEQSEQDDGGVLKREIARVITAGTIVEEELLQPKKQNYLAAVVKSSNGFVFAWVDLSSNNFFCHSGISLLNGIEMIMPSELLISKALASNMENLEQCEFAVTHYDDEFIKDALVVFQDFYKGNFLYKLSKSEILVSR